MLINVTHYHKINEFIDKNKANFVIKYKNTLYGLNINKNYKILKYIHCIIIFIRFYNNL